MARKKRRATKKKVTTNKRAKPISFKQFYSPDGVYTVHPVTDMEKSKEFYINILELEINYEAPPEFGWLEFKLPVKGSFLGLGKYNEEQQGPFKSVNALNISVSDLEQAKQALASKGIETSDYLDIPDMISMFHIKDPDENGIYFIGTPRVKSK